MTRTSALWLSVTWALATTVSAQSIVTPPTKLSPFAGHFYTPAQPNNGFRGTDLGFAFRHQDKLWFLYGDSWADTQNTPIGAPSDDAVAFLKFSDWDSGAKVEQWVNTHPAPFGSPWLAQSPPLAFPLNAGKVAPIVAFRGGTEPLTMSLNVTPMAGFSNARDDARGGAAFAIIGQFTPRQCGAGCPADQGLTCDPGMGLTAGAITADRVPCVLGSANCEPVPGNGLCEDQNSSVYDLSDEGRILSVALNFEVGNAVQGQLNRFHTKTWPTNKFINPATRTVKKFVPTADPNSAVGHDYAVATGTGTMDEKVFLWGRPNFEGVKFFGRDLGLYFAYLDMPSYEPSGNINWKPHYFVKLEAGKPVFSDNPKDATALDLRGFPTPQTEQWDITNQMSISWVAPIKKWVMLYGGGNSFLFSLLGSGLSALFQQTDPDNAIHVRFADHPWGPWSAPQQALRAGDPNIIPPLVGSEYGPLGIMHHDFCVPTPFCVGGELTPAYAVTPWGFMYAPAIVDEWTTPKTGPFGRQEADIYWQVSTWDPYQTVLLRSRVRP